VRVRVFSDDGGWWAVMPNENQTIIPVSEADLTPAYAGAAVDRHAAGISASPESRCCATTLKSFDYRERGASFINRLPAPFVDDIVTNLLDLLDSVA